jgi:hypothetical protein
VKTEAEMQAYLEYQGVPFVRPIYGGVSVLRVMDVTQIPQSMREQFDERGFFIAPKEESKPKGDKE